MANGTPNPLTNELVTFVQHQLPGLDAGEYQLTVSQHVLDSGGKPVSDETLSSQYTFAVLGDRFGLTKPGVTLQSVFPPQDAVGEFSSVLPHVVLSEPNLPWSRYPTSVLPYAKPLPGQDVEADVPTWLAVLVLDAEDVAAFPALQLEPVAATVGDLFAPSLVHGSTLGQNYSYFWRETKNVSLEPSQTVQDQIRILDVPLNLFWQIAPTIADLALTAHTREVSLINKPTGQTTASGVPTGTSSIVFATRLPGAPSGANAGAARKTYAYLVSLEQLQPFLPTAETGGPPMDAGFNANASLRLAVLASWTFSTTGTPAGFVDTLLALNGRASGGPDAVNSTLRLEYAGTNTVVKAALDMGFVPLNATLRDAGKTVSWYRGPCAPYNNTEPPLTLPLTSADDGLGFDPTTGMMDGSYAAAWMLGRQLALQDSAFATALYRWKTDQTAAVVAAAEAEFLASMFAVPGLPGRDADVAPPEGSARGLRREAMLALAGKAGSRARPHS